MQQVIPINKIKRLTESAKYKKQITWRETMNFSHRDKNPLLYRTLLLYLLVGQRLDLVQLAMKVEKLLIKNYYFAFSRRMTKNKDATAAPKFFDNSNEIYTIK